MSPEHQLWYQNELNRLDRSMRRQWIAGMLALIASIACVLWFAWRFVLWAILSGGV